MMEHTEVQTSYGPVRGRKQGNVCVWRGIPFAKAPVGHLRLQPPQPLEPWTEVRSAFEFGPAAIQPTQSALSNLLRSPHFTQSEDCLYLNVWSPAADKQKRPVMVWIHGGAYVTGSGAIAWYDGTSFAERGNVVLVTVNYRLGALGFLHLAKSFDGSFAGSGNLGLLDQIAALQWVQKNIEAFGGDATRVTIFGESAGAGSVGALLAVKQAEGLFQQAIMQSGSGSLGVRTADKAANYASQVIESLNVQPGDVEALLAVPVERFVEAAGKVVSEGLPFGPVMDGVVLNTHPHVALRNGRARHIPILIGANLEEYKLYMALNFAWHKEDEAQLSSLARGVIGSIPTSVMNFYLQEPTSASLYDRFSKLLTYRVFVHGMLETADAQVSEGADIWCYRFDWQSPAVEGRLGACHAQEIPFVFNTIGQRGVEQFTGDAPERAQIALAMHHAWIAFAHTGNPNCADLPMWPAYADAKAVMVFGVDMRVECNPYGPEQQVWHTEKVGPETDV